MEEITVQQFKDKIDADNPDVFLLDVRETFEQYQSKIDYENSKLIPVGELQSRLDELDAQKESEIVCLCRSGGRSEQACKLLEKEGFENVKNLKGGINEWAREIDTSLPIY
jgi:rhodanese-related sulfurtransferase